MPTASDEERGLMQKWFGDAVSEQGPMKFLESHGFELSKAWEWKLPTKYHQISCYEFACIIFLVHEWDFGGIEDDNDSRTVCLCGKWNGNHPY